MNTYNPNRFTRPAQPVQKAIEPEHAEALAQLFLNDNKELSDLRDRSAGFDMGKTDLWGTVSTIHNKTERAHTFEFTGDGRLAAIDIETGAETVPAPINDIALGHISQKLGPALYGKGSNKSVPMDLLKAARGHKAAGVNSSMSRFLNALIQENKNSPWLVRYATQDQVPFVRAVMSATHYAPVENTAMIDTLAAALQLQRQAYGDAVQDIKFVRPYVGISDMHITAVVKGIQPKDELAPDYSGGNDTPGGTAYGIGVHLSNAEDGTGGLRVTPLIQRHSCTNSIILNQAATLAVAHVGLSSSLIYNMTQAIGNALVLGVKHMETLLDSRAIELPNIMDIISKLAKAKGWSEETTNIVRTGTEGQTNLYGLTNGITWVAARSDMTAQRRHEFETLAGDVLLKPTTVVGKEQWAVSFERAHAIR